MFYISNRSESLFKATVDNLDSQGFPFADSTHVLLKKDTSSKDSRRAQVMEAYHILLFVGDNLGDFDGIFDNRSDDYGKPQVRAHEDQFGGRFIVLPNPVYGSWQRALTEDGMPGREEALKLLKGY